MAGLQKLDPMIAACGEPVRVCLPPPPLPQPSPPVPPPPGAATVTSHSGVDALLSRWPGWGPAASPVLQPLVGSCRQAGGLMF